MARILLADDDVELCRMLQEYLQAEGFSVDTAHDGETALAKAMTGDFDLVVLDVMMPRKNGFDVLRELRAHALTPVLMLTARGDDIDSVLGLELGADDYLGKPCNPRVLNARIRAVLRRSEPRSPEEGSGAAETLQVDDLTLHTGTRSVRSAEQPVALTSTEFRVLEVLLREAGHVIPKSSLSERALGRRLASFDRSLDMHVSNLRRKLGPLPDGEERIKTVRGVGYQYVVK
ncbi:MAG: response regulator transcription factor [Betaproteobacteria bacterium]|nr:response regulator transcription factor [Betaproteobacteria bacterium]